MFFFVALYFAFENKALLLALVMLFEDTAFWPVGGRRGSMATQIWLNRCKAWRMTVVRGNFAQQREKARTKVCPGQFT